VSRRLDLTPRGTGCTLRLRVKTGARSTGIGPDHDGALRVRVTEAPERGRANRAIVRLLAAELGVPASAMEWVSGESSQSKIIWIPLKPRELEERLTSLPEH